MTILVEALELILIVPLSTTNKHLKAGDTLNLTLNLFDDSEFVSLSIDIDKDTIIKENMLLIYNGQNPKDILKAKAALLGYETCSDHIVNDIPIIICVDKMF